MAKDAGQYTNNLLHVDSLTTSTFSSMTLKEAIDLIGQNIAAFEHDDVLRHLVQTREETVGKPTIADTIRIEEETRLEVSDACLDYAAFDNWRALPPAQQLLIYERLRAARAFLALFEHAELAGHLRPIQINPATDHHKLISFLLIDYWGLVGRRLWLGRLHHLHTH